MAAVIDAVELSEAPRVKLGGKEWPIPKLAARQNKRIVPAIGRLSKMQQALTEDDIETVYQVCYVALTRTQPALTREEFDDMPVTVGEAFEAVPVIARQAGMAMAGAPASGNAEPAETPPVLESTGPI